MMEFTKTSIPAQKVNRKEAAPNPYLALVAGLNAERGTAVTGGIVVKGEDGKAIKNPTPEQIDKTAAKETRLFHEAGAQQTPPVSVRVKREGDALTVWVIDRVTRTKKSEPED